MKEDRNCGFDYCLSSETLSGYKNKPVELRLDWLYAGNVLKKAYPLKIKRLHDEFRTHFKR
ncbi:MAG: hypothetical protein ABIG11_04260 [bacterium]